MIQSQVCNAVYVRLNYTQPLCACPSRYKEPCSASLNADDLHTTELSTDPNGKVSKTKTKTIRIILSLDRKVYNALSDNPNIRIRCVLFTTYIL